MKREIHGISKVIDEDQPTWLFDFACPDRDVELSPPLPSNFIACAAPSPM
tara:strand:- start:80 stop:229 length:150 start_codon:yes stop_codon:yes gene_type:complete